MAIKPDAVFTATDGKVVRCLPLGLGAIDSATEWQRVLAISEWSADDQEEALSFYLISIRNDGTKNSLVGCDVLRRFAVQHTIQALEVADLGHKGILLLAGTSKGGLLRLQLRYLKFPIEDADDIEWTLSDSNEDDNNRLSYWSQNHKAEVTGIDCSPDTAQAVSVGRDGAIWLADLRKAQESFAFKPPRETASYSAVKWASAATFVTAGSTGGLELWDHRKPGGKPTARSPLAWGHTGCGSLDHQQGLRRRLTCLGVHSSRPHLCVSGCSGATVVIWDLRFQIKPITQSAASPFSGTVTEVCFDSLGVGGPEAAVLFSTDDGHLYCTPRLEGREAELSHLPRKAVCLLDEDAYCIPSFSIDAGNHHDIFALGGRESVLFVSR